MLKPTPRPMASWNGRIRVSTYPRRSGKHVRLTAAMTTTAATMRIIKYFFLFRRASPFSFCQARNFSDWSNREDDVRSHSRGHESYDSLESGPLPSSNPVNSVHTLQRQHHHRLPSRYLAAHAARLRCLWSLPVCRHRSAGAGIPPSCFLHGRCDAVGGTRRWARLSGRRRSVSRPFRGQVRLLRGSLIVGLILSDPIQLVINLRDSSRRGVTGFSTQRSKVAREWTRFVCAGPCCGSMRLMECPYNVQKKQVCFRLSRRER